MRMPLKHNRTIREPPASRLLDLVRRNGTLRSSEAVKHGIPATYLSRLVKTGQLLQVSRGAYRLADDSEATGPHHGFVLVALSSPRAVVSLLSALAFHSLTSQLPSEVWITIGPKAHTPKIPWPSLHVTHASGEVLTAGVEIVELEGIPVRVFSPAKTVVDCFKHRNKIGLDVALEALKAFRQRRRGGMPELERYARVCRVTQVMRPYLEALS